MIFLYFFFPLAALNQKNDCAIDFFPPSFWLIHFWECIKAKIKGHFKLSALEPPTKRARCGKTCRANPFFQTLFKSPSLLRVWVVFSPLRRQGQNLMAPLDHRLFCSKAPEEDFRALFVYFLLSAPDRVFFFSAFFSFSTLINIQHPLKHNRVRRRRCAAAAAVRERTEVRRRSSARKADYLKTD